MFTVSRRVLLTGGGGAVLANVLGTDRALAAPDSRASVPLTVNHLLTQGVECFSEDYATAYRANWAGVLELGAAERIAAGTHAVVEFDEQTFAAGKATIFAGGSVRSLSVLNSDHSGRTRVAFDIDHGFGGGDPTVGIGLPMTPKPLYPRENIGEPQPAILTLTAPGSESPESFDLLGSVVPRAVAPWGVEVSGAWSTFDVRERTKQRSYRAPNLVRILNIGPYPAPAGTVTVTVDGSLIERLDIEKALLDGVPIDANMLPAETTRAGQELRADIGTTFEMPVGSVLEIFASPQRRGENPTVPEGIVFARAEFASIADDSRPRRATGRDTLIDVTESGTLEQSDAAKGTI
jgi:hypothetical protein